MPLLSLDQFNAPLLNISIVKNNELTLLHTFYYAINILQR